MRVSGRHAVRNGASAHARADAASASAAHRTWLANIDRYSVPPRVVAEIVRRASLSRDSFRVLDAMERIDDPNGKCFFVIPRGAGADEIRRAVVLTYILNAGTGYGAAGTAADFPQTCYGVAELDRIVARQRANRWSYTAVRGICSTGGRVVTTPNGVLMGLGGNRIHAPLTHRGGTMWGDLFMVNLRGVVASPARRLREIVESGRLRGVGPDLNRLLHHEEIHAQQWAELGPARMPARYLAEEARARLSGGVNDFEKAAGLADGGYR